MWATGPPKDVRPSRSATRRTSPADPRAPDTVRCRLAIAAATRSAAARQCLVGDVRQDVLPERAASSRPPRACPAAAAGTRRGSGRRRRPTDRGGRGRRRQDPGSPARRARRPVRTPPPPRPGRSLNESTCTLLASQTVPGRLPPTGACKREVLVLPDRWRPAVGQAAARLATGLATPRRFGDDALTRRSRDQRFLVGQLHLSAPFVLWSAGSTTGPRLGGRSR